MAVVTNKRLDLFNNVMKSWETTAFGIMAALGQVLVHAENMPGWVHLIGELLAAAGIAGLGYTAISVRGVNAQISQRTGTTPTEPITTK